jgi:hypothetical protein
MRCRTLNDLFGNHICAQFGYREQPIGSRVNHSNLYRYAHRPFQKENEMGKKMVVL